MIILSFRHKVDEDVQKHLRYACRESNIDYFLKTFC